MNKFEIISKLWPSGALLNGGVDVNTVNPPGQVFTRTAPPLAPGTVLPTATVFSSGTPVAVSPTSTR